MYIHTYTYTQDFYVLAKTIKKLKIFKCILKLRVLKQTVYNSLRLAGPKYKGLCTKHCKTRPGWGVVKALTEDLSLKPWNSSKSPSIYNTHTPVGR